jgi:DNA helicase-2/ATP-dependent DNA helicase PcrA
VASSSNRGAGYRVGERVFHDKFGYGLIAEVDGDKLLVNFDKAGQKRVVDGFVTPAAKV